MGSSPAALRSAGCLAHPTARYREPNRLDGPSSPSRRERTCSFECSRCSFNNAPPKGNRSATQPCASPRQRLPLRNRFPLGSCARLSIRPVEHSVLTTGVPFILSGRSATGRKLFTTEQFWPALDRLCSCAQRGNPGTFPQALAGHARTTQSKPGVAPLAVGTANGGVHSSRLLKKGRLPLTFNCESDSYANEWMAGGIDARIGYADG